LATSSLTRNPSQPTEAIASDAKLASTAAWDLGHYELGVEVAPVFRLATAFDELRLAI
jgi:hypothetical protein